MPNEQADPPRPPCPPGPVRRDVLPAAEQGELDTLELS